jgi:ferredoxin
MCVAVAPDVFELDDEGYSGPRQDIVPAHLQDRARAAAAACPVAAITVEETE